MMKTTRRMILLSLALILAMAVVSGCGAREGGASNLISKAGAELPKETPVGVCLETVVTLTAYTDRPELLEQGLERGGE